MGKEEPLSAKVEGGLYLLVLILDVRRLNEQEVRCDG